MAKTRTNVVANIGANASLALIAFAFVPVYIRVLGIEAYGLIGFFTSVQALLALLDLGLGAAITRELARLSAEPTDAHSARHITRTIEVLYWGIAVVVGLMGTLLFPDLALKWISLENLPAQEAHDALVLMGVALAARWPFSLYAGALVGLERQVLLNVLRVAGEGARNGGAAAVLLLVSPTLSAFLVWQIIANLATSALAAWLTWKALPDSSSPATFALGHLRRIYRYMAGMSGISVTVVVLTQADKVILSRLVSLEDFGYYMLAWAVANVLAAISAPVFTAYFPSLARAMSVGDKDTLRELYHRGSQVMSLMLLPAGITLLYFSEEALALWTSSLSIAANSAPILCVLALGTILNGLLNIPYALMLAAGWTSLPFYANTVAIIVLVPLVTAMTYTYGAIGAASAWLLLNLGHLLITPQILHHRLMPLEKSAWFVGDVLKPLLICAGIGGVGWYLFHGATAARAVLGGLGTFLVCLAACACALPYVRAGLVALRR